jgi:hypothetical protein
MLKHGKSSTHGPLTIQIYTSRKVSGAKPLSNIETYPPTIEHGNRKSTINKEDLPIQTPFVEGIQLPWLIIKG